MAKLPKLTIFRSKQTESVAFSFVTEQIFKKFYRNKGFYVLPKYIKNDCVIVYPRIVSNMSNLFRYSTPHQDNIRNPKSELIDFITDKVPFDRNITQTIEKDVVDYFERGWRSVYEIVPNLLEKTKSVEIYPTQLGSICFEYSSVGSPEEVIKIFPRFDSGISEIFKMILMSRMYRYDRKYTYEWAERMLLSEFLINHTVVNRELKGCCKVMDSLKKINKKELRIRSDNYLAELGFIN